MKALAERVHVTLECRMDACELCGIAPPPSGRTGAEPPPCGCRCHRPERDVHPMAPTAPPYRKAP
ncbi:hypothetical protein CRV15_25725 [Streptomyces clavuligerus]|uniref:Uncharacterized protein n=1 Tax=Streptomyces clavuligerus TaxID=1901 RepID=B5H2L2_STRCL|nr:hypothetical protein D1794_26360 [Streptomyces clavuligerus]EDY52808.1 hypothetical protein SSCG_05843 [Streptomyces clavuligerus]EFG05575.1 Hypothetical protein SCLAV_0499 [Streptomyces clavuligerus]QCS08711.1 hypothetical protein CRV15_25725 [Streptomyces clavuligerus]QPJ91955.1 hypothetical protein GE265_02415 [Streptomyces clavuligerus]